MTVRLAALAVGILLCGSVNEAVAQDRLIDAVRANDIATVRTLLAQHVDVNTAQPDGATALHRAVEGEATEIVQLLIRAGANEPSLRRALRRLGDAAALQPRLRGDHHRTPSAKRAAPIATGG